jgi:hypothetical protein
MCRRAGRISRLDQDQSVSRALAYRSISSKMEHHMKNSAGICAGTIFALLFCGAGVAAPANPDAVRPAPQVDCQRLGSEVSALIDTRADSPNINVARSTFQVGIMECMEGADDAANKHYQDAKKLLTQDAPKPTSTIQVPAAGR